MRNGMGIVGKMNKIKGQFMKKKKTRNTNGKRSWMRNFLLNLTNVLDIL